MPCLVLFSKIQDVISRLLKSLYIPKIHITDVIEILIITLLIYVFLNWIKTTRAYNLLKGMVMIFGFLLIANFLQMNTILWIARTIGPSAITALIIIFHPELRKALEKIGQQRFLSGFLTLDPNRDSGEFYSDATINEIVRAVGDMSSERTGALIVVEQNILLDEYIGTGISIDAAVSSQLLCNIFEHNTPLHDGAVIVRGDRIASATSYLPLSDSESISKRFGTRHRAGIGISEVSDSFTIIVSEETGRICYAVGGKLTTGVSISELREKLYEMQKKHREREKRNKLWKRHEKDEDKAAQ